MAQILYVDGTTQEVQPQNGRSFTLKEAQQIVGGYVEVIRTHDGRILIVHEEAKLLDMPRNAQATRLVHFPTVEEQRMMVSQSGVIFVGDPNEEDYIAGTALLCEDREFR